MQPHTSKSILEALRLHYDKAAIVPELVLNDEAWLEHWKQDVPTTSTRRIDALMIQAHQRTAIEIKVSAQDFKRDTWQKRRPWARLVHRYVYVTPYGLDFPPFAQDGSHFHGCGLWWVDESGKVTVKKKAIIQPYPEQLPNQVIQNLAYRAANNSRTDLN